MFRNHQGERGHWFRSQFRALEARLGPFDAISRQYAAGVAALHCEWRADVRALEAAEDAREHGKGRRPSVSGIARFKKRAALTWGSYDTALRRLEELTARTRKVSPLHAVHQAVAEANRR